MQLLKFAYKNSETNLLIWLVVPLFITALILKSPSQRYLVSLLPLFSLLFASYFLRINKKKIFSIFLLVLSLMFPLFMSLFQIYQPLNYFKTSNEITSISEYELVSGQTSGYGFLEVLNFLESKNDISPIVVTYAENSGNPESALSVFLNKKNIMNGYLEGKYLQNMSEDIECIELISGQDMYFISRDEQLVGLDKYVEKVLHIKKPISENTLGIYLFKKGCANPSKVNPVFTP